MISSANSNRSLIFLPLFPVFLILSHHELVTHKHLLITANFAYEPNICGNISIKPPFSLQNRIPASKNHNSYTLFCKSNAELYIRTSTGCLFTVSSIDYETKQLTVLAKTPSRTFISHHILFPSLLNNSFIILATNYSTKGLDTEKINNCLLLHLIKRYNRTRRLLNDHGEGKEEGRPVEFDRVSVEVGDACAQCRNPNRISCGPALRCFCHPKQCGEKIINRGVRRLVGTRDVVFFLTMVLCSTVRIL